MLFLVRNKNSRGRLVEVGSGSSQPRMPGLSSPVSSVDWLGSQGWSLWFSDGCHSCKDCAIVTVSCQMKGVSYDLPRGDIELHVCV